MTRLSHPAPIWSNPHGATPFARWLLRRRRALGLTVRELSRRAVVSPSQVYGWEELGRYPTRETLGRVVDVMGEPGLLKE